MVMETLHALSNVFIVSDFPLSDLLVSPGSSSEKVRNPLFISSVLGANILEVAVRGGLGVAYDVNNFSVLLTGSIF